jgi:aromatic ring-opening dioxygenase catalytic subunit (LigB family)
MLVSHALLVPHLPTLVLDQHRGHRTPMLDALVHASERLLAESPQAIVALSARWNAAGPFRVDSGRRHRTLTDYTGFGVEVRYDCPGHPALARALVEAGERRRLPVASAERGVDSGVSVPLHFLAPRGQIPVVPLSMPARDPAECRTWGDTLRRELAAWPERVAFVIGGVLSLNLHAWSLRRDVPEAAALDAWALDLLGRGAWGDLSASFPGRLVEHAQPEASLRHLEVMRGFLGLDRPGVVRCYESGPGVGAALVEFALEAAAEAPQGA